MNLHLPRVLTSVLVLASLAAAQTVHLTGRIERAPANPCDPTATHRIACTDVLLKSTAVDLTTLEGRLQVLDGTVTGLTCPIIDVTVAANAPYSHTVTSNNQFRLGSNVTFRGTGPFLSIVPLILSGGTSFVPLGTFGAYYLDLPTSLLISFNTALLGFTTWVIQIPNDPSLINAPIWSQTAWITITPATDGSFVNAACFTIIQ